VFSPQEVVNGRQLVDLAPTVLSRAGARGPGGCGDVWPAPSSSMGESRADPRTLRGPRGPGAGAVPDWRGRPPASGAAAARRGRRRAVGRGWGPAASTTIAHRLLSIR